MDDDDNEVNLFCSFCWWWWECLPCWRGLEVWLTTCC